MSDPSPEGQQVEALRGMRTWFKAWRNGEKAAPFFYLAGYAGVGKTFLVKHFLKEEGLRTYDIAMMTFMARSALVLQRASGFPVRTVHSAIYRRVRELDGREAWRLDRDSSVREAKLIILDECSTIGKKMFEDILSFNRPVLILGDPGQLLPVNDEPFFQNKTPDYFLTEVRRQALDNPIIRLSMMAREGEEIPYGDHGLVKKLPVGEYSVDTWTGVETVIAATNAMRLRLNQAFRSFKGYAERSPNYPVAGEKLMCLRNKHDMGLVNGMVGTCLRDVSPPEHEGMWTVDVDFQPEGSEREYVNLTALRSYFDPRLDAYGREIETPRFLQGKSHHFTYAYAITCHKALGSQYESVLVVDEGNQRERARWLYTAVTRAVETLYIAA